MSYYRWLLFIIVLAIGTPYCEGQSYDLTFYHVGQGNCTIVKSPTRQVLLIDAGSSSTIGVSGIDSSDEEGKYEQLANKIVKHIKKDIGQRKWLYFIVSHADKDHLNLIKPIITKSGFLDKDKRQPLPGYTIGVLFGGDPHIYSKGEGGALVSFLKEYNIEHCFGKNDYELQPPPGLFYVRKATTPATLEEWNGIIDFLSVGKDVQSRQLGSTEDVNNASSIVMKVHCGTRSLMLTGDKTKREINYLINRFKSHHQDQLKADILLATHHGSLEDFVKEWVTLTQPEHIIFSAGRSSFFHPRSEAFEGYFSSTNLTEVEWHFVQFYGDMINSADDFLRSIVTEVPQTEERARGYVHALTNRSIFVTGSQGNITFTLENGKRVLYKADPTWQQWETAIHEFLTNPTLPDKTAIDFNGVYLDGITSINVSTLLQKFQTVQSLVKLSLKDCTTLDDTHVLELSELIKKIPTLIFLNLDGTQLNQDSRRLIKKAWHHRGLIFQ